MSHSHKLRTTTEAVTAFNTARKPAIRGALPNPKKNRYQSTKRHVSLELISHLTVDYSSPFLLASSGNIEGLKSFIETYGSILEMQDENHATPLHHASSTNQISVLEYLIDSGIKLNTTDKNGNTALHIATLQEHVQATTVLLNSGIEDKIINLEGDTGLHIAARSNNTILIASYLEYSDVNAVVEGYRKRTPMHIIAEYDNLEACKVFHNLSLRQEYRGKKIFRMCSKDEDGLTPMHIAAQMGSYKVLDFFMTVCEQHDYPLEVILGFLDEENSTPLHAAVDAGHTKVVEVLLKHEANPEINKDSQVPPFLLACSQGKMEMIEMMINHCNSSDIISCRDLYGHTCLHCCIQSINSNKIINFLIGGGAEINAVNNKGQTPLIISTIYGSTQAVTTLLEREADVLIQDIEGNNAMHHAVTRSRKKIIELLLKHPKAGDLVMCMNKKNQSPFHNALRLGFFEVISPIVAIIKHKFKNIKDDNGNNYLHLAAQGGDWKTINILLEIPECLKLLNEINKDGGTPLHIGAIFGSLGCVKILLSHGAMVHKCHTGTTPFMNACLKGHSEVASILFDAHPFQLNWTTDDGENSLHMAARSNNPHMITLLLDIGIPIVHNIKQESFFDMIILKNELRCAAAVIQHSRYHEALDLVSPVHQHPMINLIINMPEIAKQVLDRSLTKSELAHQNSDYWERYDFKFLHLNDHDYLQEEKMENQSKHIDNDLREFNITKYKEGIKRLVPRNPSKPESLHHLRALRTMVQFNRCTLLTHPVCDAFFKNKWRNYGRYIHILLTSSVFVQVLFTLLFTALILYPTNIFTNLELTNSSSFCWNRTNETNGTIRCMKFWYGINVCRFIALLFATFNFIVWLMSVLKIRLEALDLISNSYILIDLLSVVFTVYYLIPTRGYDNAYFQAGAIASFLSWFSLVLKLQLFDVFGIYITMLLTIIRTVLKVFIICFLFITAFSISLFILAGNLTQYSTIGYSIFVNLGHFLGELDYEAFVNEDVNGNLEYDWLTFIFMSTIAILMGIVIMNLLIGLAVGDIEQIRKNAIMGKKVVELSFYFQIDCIISSRMLSKLDKLSYTKYPNKKVNVIIKFWRAFWHYLKSQNQSIVETGANPAHEVGINHNNIDLLLLKGKVDEVTLKQEKILETLAHMQKMQENIMSMFTNKNGDNDHY